jgi:anti-sigma factor RsiW
MSDTMHDRFVDQLSEYVDGDLAAAEVTALERHLEGCETCRATVTDLRRVVERARALPVIPSPTDQWPALRARLAETPQDDVSELAPLRAPTTGLPVLDDGTQSRPRVIAIDRHPHWWQRPLTVSWAQAAAAAVLLIVLAGGGAWFALRGIGAPQVVGGSSGPVAVNAPAPAETPVQSPTTPDGTAPVSSEPAGSPLDEAPQRGRRVPAGAPASDGTVAFAASLDPRYDATVAELQRLLATGRTQLDTSTVRILEQNLAVIDRALNEAQRAVARDPANPYLRAHLASTMRRKVDLLRRATVIAGARG